MSPTPDFVDVQLAEAGKQAAGKGALRVANAHFHYEITAGKTVRVTRAYEWNKVLSQLAVNGSPMLEIAPDPAPAAPVAKKQKTIPIEEPEHAN